MSNNSENLRTRINEDMKTAMRAKEQKRLDVIRLLLAAIKQREVDERITLDDTQVLSVIDKMIKQRNESVKQYEAANRQELADQEKYEIDLLKAYLPAAMSDSEIEQAVQKAIAETGASSIKDMGKVMAILKPQLQGRADMAQVSIKIKEKLNT
jgi:uncharacterized protein YqeY